MKTLLRIVGLIILWALEKTLQAALGCIIGGTICLPIWAIGVRSFWVFDVIVSLCVMSLWGFWEGCGTPMLGLIIWPFVRDGRS